MRGPPSHRPTSDGHPRWSPNATREAGFISPQIRRGLRLLPKEPTVPAASLRPHPRGDHFVQSVPARGDACTKFAGIGRVFKGTVVLAPYPVMNFAIRLRESGTPTMAGDSSSRCTDVEYGVATAPPGRTLGVTCKGAGALTVIDRGAGVVAVCAGIAESITCSVNWNTPAIVGVPLSRSRMAKFITG